MRALEGKVAIVTGAGQGVGEGVAVALAAAGATVDPAWKLDGVNLLPFFTKEASGKPHETLYWRFGEQWAIHHGDWKLVVGRDGGKEPWLIHLAEDISESKNLAASKPEKVAELLALYQTWNAEQAPPSSPKENPNRPQRQNRRNQQRKVSAPAS